MTLKKGAGGRFPKGNKFSSKVGKEVSRMRAADARKLRAKEELEIRERVRQIRGEEQYVEATIEDLALSDQKTMMHNVRVLFERINLEIQMIQDVSDWSDPTIVRRRLELIKNISGLITLLKECTKLVEVAKAWEKTPSVSAKEAKRFYGEVVDFEARANEKLAEAERKRLAQP